MKISFLSAFFPFRGGIAQFSAHIYRNLEATDKVKAYTFSRQYPNFLFPGKTQLVQPEDQADEVPALQILDSINPFSWLKTARKIRMEQPDVFISRYWMSFFAPCLGIIARLQHRKTFKLAILDNVIPHEKRFFDHPFNRFYLKQHDAFVVMSEKVKKDLTFYLPNAKVLHLFHPIYDHFGEKLTRTAAIEQLNIQNWKDKKILLFFGIIRDYKGLDLMLESLSMLDDSYVLLIAGECYGSFEKYDALINHYQISTRVKVINKYIPDEEVKLYFSVADVCMLTYHNATQSGITNISFHFEVPVIVTPVGGLTESVKQSLTGWITEEKNAKSISETIQQFFREKKDDVIKNAIEEWNQAHNWTAFTQKMRDFILINQK
jgi:glycosyltransferase involved in cell wall biosynthesis